VRIVSVRPSAYMRVEVDSYVCALLPNARHSHAKYQAAPSINSAILSLIERYESSLLFSIMENRYALLGIIAHSLSGTKSITTHQDRWPLHY
jgi:hypothetical protein